MACVAFADSRPASAGPWLRATGETYAKASLFLTRGTEQFDASGEIAPIFDPTTAWSSRYREVGGNVYVEHGVGRDVTLILDVLMKAASLHADGFAPAFDRRSVAFGIPDLRVGGRLPLSRRSVVAALEPSLSFPLRLVDRSSADAPSVGTPSASFALAVSGGGSVPRLRAYGQASAGYRLRAGRESDEWMGDAEVGVSVAGPIGVRLRYDMVNARGARTTAGAAAMTEPETGGQDLSRIAPTLALAVGGGSELSITCRRALGGRSALRSTEWELGYSFLGR